MSSVLKSLYVISERLTAPHETLADLEHRRQSTLLARLILVLFGVMALVNLRTFFNLLEREVRPERYYFIAPFMIVTIAVFLINRKGHYSLASHLFVTISFILITGYSIYWMPGLYYMPVVVLLSALFLPERETLLFASAVAGVVILFVFRYGLDMVQEITLDSITDYTILSLPLIVTYIVHRRRLETERSRELQDANERLRASEALLEQRVMERTRALEIALTEIEALYVISKSINAAQSFTQIVEAVANHLDDLNYTISLGVYEGFDHKTASYFELVAVRPAGMRDVQAISLQFSVHHADRWIERDEVYVANDLNLPPPDLREEVVTYFKCFNIGSFMLVPLRLGSRIVGTLNVMLPTAHEYSEREKRYVLSVGELASAAV